MQLQFKPSKENSFPLRAVLIQESNIQKWITEIEAMQLTVQEIYPLKNISSIENAAFFGCLVVFENEEGKIDKQKFRANALFQWVNESIFVPEYTTIFPLLSREELQELCNGKQYLFYPNLSAEVHLIELSEEINLKELVKIGMPKLEIQNSFVSKKPAKSVSIPKNIRAFQVKPISAEDYLKHLEESIFPKDEEAKNKEDDFFNDKPLSFWEKEKLNFLKKAFGDRKDVKKDKDGNPIIDDSNILNTLGKLKGFFSKETDQKFINNLYQDYEDLEKRNQSKIDKLIELLESNPEEGLKYAIPTDIEGTQRGAKNAEIYLNKRWNDFGLFGTSNTRGGGSAPLPNNTFDVLREKYRQTAKELTEKGDYKKAAFIHLKLLKERYTAASLLEKGKLYQDAALVYLQINNKQKAAECYEKGNMIKEAIEIYKELNKDEKVGDLYKTIDKKKEADFYYQKVVDGYTEQNRYVLAAIIYRNKMQQPMQGQEVLLEGWEKKIDAFNCLNNYFVNLRNDTENEDIIRKTIDDVYEKAKLNHSEKLFLDMLHFEYAKEQSQELSSYIREMAYKIIAQNINKGINIEESLRIFNPNDKMIKKEASRYRAKR